MTGEHELIRELIGAYEELIEHLGDDMGDSRRARIETLEAALSRPRQEASGEVRVSAADAFEMGYVWAGMLTGQTLEDSRAVGRTLRSDIFEPIADRIDAIAKEEGYDSFKDAEHGIWAAKIIIKRALSAQPLADAGDVPIPMLLWCPQCHLQHIDEPDERTPDWDNPPHRSHLCHGCGCIWRPADIPTEGVASIQTKGKADTFEPSTAPDELRAEGDVVGRFQHLMKMQDHAGVSNIIIAPEIARDLLAALARPDRMAELAVYYCTSCNADWHSTDGKCVLCRRGEMSQSPRAALSASEGGR